MEATVLGILIVGGMILNNNEKSSEDNKNISLIKKNFDKKNIYTTDNINTARNIMKNKGLTNIKKSNDPANTNIIPIHYNKNTIDYTKQLIHNQSKQNNENYVKSLSNFDSLLDNNSKQNENKLLTEYFQNINSSNGNNDFDNNNNKQLNGSDTDIMLSNSLDTVFKNEPVKDHNNMVPFFGSHITQTTDTNRLNTHKIEIQSGSQNYKPKREQNAQLPQKNISYINGAPVTRDMSKYTKSMYRPDENPIVSINVGPGIGKGYDSYGSGGFHNSYRLPYKNIDSLRTKNEKN